MPKTKSLKELADDYGVHPSTLMRWLHKKFPDWYQFRKKSTSTMNAQKYQNKGSYTPKEIKMIYEYYGEPSID